MGKRFEMFSCQFLLQTENFLVRSFFGEYVMIRKLLLVMLAGVPVYLNCATFSQKSKTFAKEDIGFCSVPFTRDCDTANVDNPCEGDCEEKETGDFCGYDTLLSDLDTYEWILPALAGGKEEVNTDLPKVNCGLVYDCECNANLICAHTFHNGQAWMQSQMTPSGDDCPIISGANASSSALSQ